MQSRINSSDRLLGVRLCYVREFGAPMQTTAGRPPPPSCASVFLKRSQGLTTPRAVYAI